MLGTFLLMALLQDGPVQTAPRPLETQVAAAAPAADGAEPTATEICDSPVNRRVTESAFDCATRLERERRGPMRYGALTRAAGREADGEVPGWALADPARWEASQCGADGDNACRRRARNQLAMARAGVAAEPPAPTGGPAAAPQNCRTVMRRSESGFGGSLSRVCGDGAESEAALDRLEESLRPPVEPCDQPGALESQDAWIARCRALPPR
jgi:hypothetical protein